MLETLRRGATKILIVVLFSVLIFSFAIWGIGDMVRGVAQGPLARVGKTDIRVEEFNAALQNRRQALSRQFGQPITPEQSRAFGIDASVLGELINGAAVTNHADAIGLKLSDATIAEAIRQDPLFQGADKKFNRTLFDERMRQAGFSERRYFLDRQAGELREQLTEALTVGVTPAATMVTIAHKYREETRTIASFTLDPAKAPKPAEPDEDKLKATYEQSKRQFVSPETRQISTLFLSLDDLKTRAKIEDGDVRTAWEQAKTTWDVPERRRLQQILFKSKTEAQDAAKAMAGGKSFLIVALETNGAQGRLDQGLVSRREISDAKISTAAFSLPINQLSEPLDVRGGTLLMRVTEIEPGRSRGFEEVAGEIRQSLEQTRQRELATKLHDQIEDMRGAGRSLRQIAEELKLRIIEIASVDKSGKSADGKPALEHADAAKIVAAAFEGEKEVPRDVVPLSDGSEAWVDVLAVAHEKQKSLDEVRTEVRALWLDQESRKALASEAQDLAARIKAGATIETVAKSLGLTVDVSQPFKRNSPNPKLAPAAIRLAFTLPKDGVSAAESADGKSRTVFVVTDIKVPDAPTTAETERLTRELSSQLQRDVLDAFVGGLRVRQGVSINEAVYKRAVGLDQSQ